MNILSNENKLIKDRINALIKALSNGIYERESTIRLCLLAALSGESVFLLGPPGIAKSLIAKRLIQAFDNASFFDYLMTRFSTPEEVFGPLSIQELKDNGNYVRLTTGYLPDADVVFLDEIWKAGPSILNTLLTVINERTFKNGQQTLQIPMRLLITASNELPEEGSGLDALYDRMLVRLYINRIQEKKNFQALLMGDSKLADVPSKLAISDEEFYSWQSQINNVTLPPQIFESIYQLKLQLEKIAKQETTYQAHDLYVSDRRWKKSIRLLKACAYFNGRQEIIPLDLIVLKDCLWNTPETRTLIETIIDNFSTQYAFGQKSIQQSIEDSLHYINEAKEKMITHLTTTMKLDKGRLKNQFKVDISDAPRFTVNSNKQMVKLLLLEVNQSISEKQLGDSEWVYIDADDFLKKIKTGKCEIYGYINRHLTLSPINLEVDAHQRLVVKDTSNRSINVGFVHNNALALSELPNWIALIEQAQQKLALALKNKNKERAKFHADLPHNFLEKKSVLAIDATFVQLTKNVELLEIEIKKNTQRILNLESYFQGSVGN